MIAAEPRPTTAEQLDDEFALAKEAADGCAKQYGDALGTFNTVDTARDMDRLRQALDEDKLTYLGYSYGTTLGSTYAELFPDKVRAMVLDGAVDPDADPKPTPRPVPRASRAASTPSPRTAPGCSPAARSAPSRASSSSGCSARRTDTDPQREKGETRKATAGIVLTAIQAALYDTDSWPQLAQSLAAGGGDAKGLFSLADNYTGRMEDGNVLQPARREPGDQLRRHRADLRRGRHAGAGRRVGRQVPAVRRGLGGRALHLLGVEGRPHAAARARRRRAARRSSSSATPATR